MWNHIKHKRVQTPTSETLQRDIKGVTNNENLEEKYKIMKNYKPFKVVLFQRACEFIFLPYFLVTAPSQIWALILTL